MSQRMIALVLLCTTISDAQTVALQNGCEDACSPTGDMRTNLGCHSSYCHQYRCDGHLHHRCDPSSSQHNFALTECKATCELCKPSSSSNMALCRGTPGDVQGRLDCATEVMNPDKWPASTEQGTFPPNGAPTGICVASFGFSRRAAICRHEFGNPAVCPDYVSWQGVRVQFPNEKSNAACVSYGSPDAARSSFWCDGSGRVCTKISTGRVPQMTARAGTLKMKRTSCDGTKCEVFKSGACLNIPEGAIPGFVARGSTGQKLNDNGCEIGHYTVASGLPVTLWQGGGQNDLSWYTVDTCAMFCEAKQDCTHFMVSATGRCQLVSSSCSQYAETDSVAQHDTAAEAWKFYKKVALQAAHSDQIPVGCEPFCSDPVEKARAMLQVGRFPIGIFTDGMGSPKGVQMTWTAGTLQERQIFGLAATALLRASNNNASAHFCKATDIGFLLSDEKLGIQDVIMA